MTDENKITNAVELLTAIIKLKAGGETRQQQADAVASIEASLEAQENLLVEAPTGAGKALHVATPILTTGGWKTMGSLTPGDYVFGLDGKPTLVTDTLTPYVTDDVYEVVFSDGSKLIADGSHLWATSTRRMREHGFFNTNRQEKYSLSSRSRLDLYKKELTAMVSVLPETIAPIVLSRKSSLTYNEVLEACQLLPVAGFSAGGYKKYDTKNLLEQIYFNALNSETIKTSWGLKLSIASTREIRDTLKVGAGNKYTNHCIPSVDGPLIFPESEKVELPLPPYTFGAWLGDGASAGGYISSHDHELNSYIEADGIYVTPRKDPNLFGLNFSPIPVNNRWVPSVTKTLTEMDVRNNKHIPERYLHASVKDRLALLSGLLDTDGYASRNGTYEICVTSQSLIEDIYELVNGLGFRGSIREGIAKLNGVVIGPKWTVSFTSEENLFCLTRKRKMFEERFNARNLNILRTKTRYIVSVTKVDPQEVRCITVDSKDHLFLAGKSLIPTHNTLSYLIPIIFNNSRAVISTATKQLSEQVMNIDYPFLRKALKEVAPGLSFNAALLKGRDNYFCLAKAESTKELGRQADALFEVEDLGKNKSGSVKGKAKAVEIQKIQGWGEKTKSGDRSEAPAVSDDTWRQFSSTSGECPGKQVCPFGDVCFAEFARDKARKAQVVVTNHAVVGHDLMQEESTMLGDRDVFIFDELHELDNYLSSAWGTRLTAKMLKDAHKVFSSLPDLDDKTVGEVELLSRKFAGVCESVPEGVIEGNPQLLSQLASRLYAACSKLAMAGGKVAKDDGQRESLRQLGSVVSKRATELMDSAQLILDDSPSTVRWVTESEDGLKAVNAAPLRVGPQLQLALESRDAHMVGTSATIRVSGDFRIPVHNLALDTASADFKTVALTSPFDYKKQAVMYIPTPNSFPAPVGADRKEHSAAVMKEVGDLVEASDGRALCLFTTMFAAVENGKMLRKRFPKLNILVQGEAPPAQLVEEFKKDERSVLVATMGMWHGLDAVGPTCSLVVMDKIPFKPMNDPLSVARQKWADENGRNGFMDVYVADANVMLAQGAGRLVRSGSDRGVVAILDTRLVSKPYGRSMLKSLPPMTVFQDKTKIVAALKRLADGLNKK